MVNPVNFKDLTGNLYGRLTVLERAADLGNRVAYKCQCTCGSSVVVRAGSLRNGATKSCGCLHVELSGKDLSGNKFGFWSITNVVPVRRTPDGYRFWNCTCICGIEREVSGKSLLGKKSTSCGSCSHAKRFCLREHDTKVWGRTSSGACRACLRDRHLRTNYGISLEEFEEIYKLQEGKCAICSKVLGMYKPGKPGFGKGCRIEVDHDHKKKKRFSVRGLLCGGRWAGCNRKLGRIDTLPWLNNVIAYLEDPPAQRIIK